MKTAASVMEAADLLCTDVDCIRNGDLMAVCDAVCSLECKGSYGTAFFDGMFRRNHSFAENGRCMSVSFRKIAQFLEKKVRINISLTGKLLVDKKDRSFS